ncbi:FAD-dependent oxidoreductase [Sulfolobales archaeon HS-7]|nr:FAD-dependent oxidoreductase [Sulfolobales archaeon HS-7]
MSSYDVIIVGGGHNGLVAASYLAMNGMKVAVLERRPIIGGACTTEELWPGIKVSTGAYVLSLLRPKIIKDLNLYQRGLKVKIKDPGLFLPTSKGGLYIWSDLKKTQREIEKYSKRDAEFYAKWSDLWEKFSYLADIFMLNPPPQLDQLSNLFGGMGNEEDSLSFLRVVLSDAKSMLNEYFESEEVKSALAEDSVVGTFSPPSAPGTAYVLAHHVIGEVNGVKGAWGYPEGGMGSVTQSLMIAAKENGVDVFLNTRVDEILVHNGKAVGVKLDNGKVINSKYVLSNADPKTTFLKLLRNAELESRYLNRIASLKTEGVSFKIVGYLEELPDFGHGKNLSPEHGSSILIIDSLEHLEKSYADAVATGFSKRPWLSINILNINDQTLAPSGYFVFSIFGQYLRYSRKLDEKKEEIYQTVLEEIREYAPNFRPVKYEVLTPLDIERRFGIWEGNIFHLDMTPDQMLFFRPTEFMNKYRTPIKGLYLCGAGTHPGGGVTGAPGYNAAMTLLDDVKRGS